MSIPTIHHTKSRVLFTQVCCAFMLIAVSARVASALALYVSLSGNDSWSGTLAAPNNQNSDGPLQTFEKARDVMRQYRTQNGYHYEGMIVNVRGGVYPVSATFSLKALDSGTTSAPVIWQAYQNESVRLLAGLMVTNFEAVTDPGILARLSPAARQSVKVANVGALGLTTFPAINQGGLHMQLYQDSSATHVARFPNDGWLLIRDVPANCASPIRGDATKGNYHCGRIGYSDPRPSR